MHDAPLLSGEDGSTDKPQAKPAAFHLKRLEMVGFKSFAERTRLEFEPGITAVVGPNGCGKSNVVDAIRWCLGEMSAKSLRSKMLVDVIFNGSANRAPTHMAEVSLTFDNSQNRLPVDYSEVTITRRLFRSGESEYFINKTQCRLRDIHELFLDTGIGEEGYSIMEQGRVEYILNARPEERRELFEEAAGVSKYKARREECLRKMERTQLDLDRLADVIAMTKEQMDKIEAAVRKARQYQKLQEDLKSLEIAHWLWEISQMDQEIAGLKAEIAGLENDLQSTTTEIDQMEAKLAELRLGETELGERLVSLNRQISEVDGHMALAEQKQANAREREEEIRRRETVLEGEIAQGRARLEELGRSGAEVESSLEAEKRAAEEAAALRQKQDENHRTLLENQKALEKRARISKTICGKTTRNARGSTTRSPPSAPWKRASTWSKKSWKRTVSRRRRNAAPRPRPGPGKTRRSARSWNSWKARRGRLSPRCRIWKRASSPWRKSYPTRRPVITRPRPGGRRSRPPPLPTPTPRAARRS